MWTLDLTFSTEYDIIKIVVMLDTLCETFKYTGAKNGRLENQHTTKI